MLSTKLLELFNLLHITNYILWIYAVEFVRLTTEPDLMSTGCKPKQDGAFIWNFKSSVLPQLHHNINKQHK